MSLVLFQPSSPANDSVVFELKQQMTVVAMGMQPDDYITFEIVLISDAARAKICGCRLLESGTVSALIAEPVGDTAPAFANAVAAEVGAALRSLAGR